MDWSEEARARLALPVDEWWSLYIKRAYEAKTSETYQVKLDVDAALGEIERLRAEVAACDGHGYLRESIEILEEALEQIDRETRCASDVTVIRLGSIARAALVGK